MWKLFAKWTVVLRDREIFLKLHKICYKLWIKEKADEILKKVQIVLEKYSILAN